VHHIEWLEFLEDCDTRIEPRWCDFASFGPGPAEINHRNDADSLSAISTGGSRVNTLVPYGQLHALHGNPELQRRR